MIWNYLAIIYSWITYPLSIIHELLHFIPLLILTHLSLKDIKISIKKGNMYVSYNKEISKLADIISTIFPFILVTPFLIFLIGVFFYKNFLIINDITSLIINVIFIFLLSVMLVVHTHGCKRDINYVISLLKK